MKILRQFLTELAESKKELNVGGYVGLYTTYEGINSCASIISDENKFVYIPNIDCCFTDYELDNYKVIGEIEIDNDLVIKVELIENKTDK